MHATNVVAHGTGSADVGAADIGSLPAGPSASGPHMQWLKVSHPNCSGSQSDERGSSGAAGRGKFRFGQASAAREVFPGKEGETQN